MIYKALFKSFSVMAIGLSIVYSSPSVANTHDELPPIHVGEIALLKAKKLFQEKKYTQALNTVDQVLQTKPLSLDAQILRGQVLLALKKNDLVIKQMDVLLSKRHNYAKAYNLRGLALYHSGTYDLALQDFNKALTLDTNDTHALFNRGNLLIAMNQIKQALLDFEKVISLDSNHFAAMLAREQAQTKLNDLNSMAKLNASIEANPNDANNYYARSVYFFNKKMYQQSIKDAELALELNPLFSEAYYIHGAALYQVGNLSLARESFFKSTQYSGCQVALEG